MSSAPVENISDSSKALKDQGTGKTQNESKCDNSQPELQVKMENANVTYSSKENIQIKTTNNNLKKTAAKEVVQEDRITLDTAVEIDKTVEIGSDRGSDTESEDLNVEFNDEDSESHDQNHDGPNKESSQSLENCDSNDKKSLEECDRPAKSEELVDSQNQYQENGNKLTANDQASGMLVDKVGELNISGDKGDSTSKSKVQSQVIVRKETESLKNLMSYEGDSSSDSESDSEQVVNVCDDSSDTDEECVTKKVWRKNKKISGTSDSESDSSDDFSSESETDTDFSPNDSVSVVDASDEGVSVENLDGDTVVQKKNDKGAVKKTNNSTAYEVDAFLPPLPDLSKLNINVEKEEFLHIGHISAIISELVTIEALRGTPAFDLDSFLFIDDESSQKKPIGPIFDVLGQVSEPIYCVRFNNNKEIQDLKLKKGMKIFAAPKSEFTKYVFVKELMKMKGSDASWLNDQEQPEEMAEFSDDEKEREAKNAKKKTNLKRKLDDSLERHKRYERTMNQCNILNTRVSRLMDAHRNLSRQIKISNNPYDRPFETDGSITPPPTFSVVLPFAPPDFNPSVPPPGFSHSPYTNGQPSASPYSGGQSPYNGGQSPYNGGQAPYNCGGQSPYNSGQSPLLTTTPSPFFANSPLTGFGEPPTFGGAPTPYNNQGAAFGGPPLLFGGQGFYSAEPPSPQNLMPPPMRWKKEGFRKTSRPRNPSSENQQNSSNHYTKNSRNAQGPGPSSKPF